MGERLTFSGLWADSKASFAANSGIYLTLGAAFMFLPQLLLGLVQPEAATAAAPMAGGRGLLFLTLLFLTLLAQFFAIVPITRTVLGGGGETVGQLLRATIARLPTLLGVFAVIFAVVFVVVFAAALLAVLFGGGDAARALSGPGRGLVAVLVLLFIPLVLWLNARLMVLMPVIAAENLGAVASIKRAWGLTRGHAGKLVGYLLLIFLIVIVLSILAGALGGALGVAATAAGSGGLGAFLVNLLGAAAGAAFGLFFAIFAAHVYRRLALG